MGSCVGLECPQCGTSSGFVTKAIGTRIDPKGDCPGHYSAAADTDIECSGCEPLEVPSYGKVQCSEHNNKIKLFGRLLSGPSCCLLILNACLAIMFCIISIIFFSAFVSNECHTTCGYTKVPHNLIHGIVSHEITLLSGCSETNYLLFSLKDNQSSVGSYIENYSFDDLQDQGSDIIGSMYIAGSDQLTPNAMGECTNVIVSDGNSAITGYIELKSDYLWDWSWQAIMCTIISIITACFFVFIQWFIFGLGMYPSDDFWLYMRLYIIRMGCMSYMLVIVIAHSFYVSGDINFLVGSFAYIWVEVDCYVAFIALFGLFGICLFRCERWGSTYERFCTTNREKNKNRDYKKKLEKEPLEQYIIAIMIFFVAFIICGFMPFTEFLFGVYGGYTNIPYVAVIWSLIMTSNTCLFFMFFCRGVIIKEPNK